MPAQSIYPMGPGWFIFFHNYDNVGGGWGDGPLFDIRDLDHLYEPQEPVEPENVEVKPEVIEAKVERYPAEFRAPPLSIPEEVTELEIVALLREIEVKKREIEISEEYKKQLIHDERLLLMLLIMLDEL